MELIIRPPGVGERDVLAQLLQLYQHDLAEAEGWRLDPDGRYTHFDLDSYLAHPAARPFLCRVDGELAGFALLLVRDAEREVYEFFVVRKFRRRGVGEQVALELFRRLPGQWRIRQSAANPSGRAFWRAVLGRYVGDFEERVFEEQHYPRSEQRFATPGS